jgi:hypothetical protein
MPSGDYFKGLASQDNGFFEGSFRRPVVRVPVSDC